MVSGTHDVQVLGHATSNKQDTALVDLLAEKGIDVSGIVTSDESWADLSVNENDADLSENWKHAIASADTLLMHREIPSQIAILAAKYAHAANCKVILDAGDSNKYNERELLENVDIFVPNKAKLNELSDATKASPK